MFSKKLEAITAYFFIFVALAGAGTGFTGRTAAAGAPVRFPNGARKLLLSEALRRALEHAGFRMHKPCAVWRISLAGVDALKAERIAARTLFNTELAYWNLYGAREQLSVHKRAVALARDALHVCEFRRNADRATGADVRLAQEQLRLAGKLANEASDKVAVSKQQLGSLMGRFHRADHLVPGDAPKLTITRPDWGASIKEALNNRVDLKQARNQLWVAQKLLDIEVLVRDLLGAPLERIPPPSGDGWRQIPPQLPRSDPRARLARAVAALRDQELKTQSFLLRQYEQLQLAHEQFRGIRFQREAFSEQVQALTKQYKAGQGTLDDLLEAQRFSTAARSSEYAAIVIYNHALAGFDFAKGAALKRHEIAIEEVGSNRLAQQAVRPR
jgi:hypothetical protein